MKSSFDCRYFNGLVHAMFHREVKYRCALNTALKWRFVAKSDLQGIFHAETVDSGADCGGMRGVRGIVGRIVVGGRERGWIERHHHVWRDRRRYLGAQVGVDVRVDVRVGVRVGVRIGVRIDVRLAANPRAF
jgi:hypothetical protein